MHRELEQQNNGIERGCRRARRSLARWRRDRGDRGATLVEAAFVFPVLVLLVFGLIEFSLVFKDYLTVANMTRAGARTSASAGANATADYDILQSVKTAGTALSHGSIQYIVIFKASAASNDMPDANCNIGSVRSKCNYYTPADLSLPKTQFGTCNNDGDATIDGAWCPKGRVNTLSGNGGVGPDYVGVFVKVRHSYISGLFGSALTLTDSTVMRIEPVAT